MENNSTTRAMGVAAALVIATLALVVVFNMAALHWNPYWRLAVTEYVCILGPALLFVRAKKLSLVEGLRLQRVSPGLLIYSGLIGAGGYGVATCLILVLLPLLGELPADFLQLTPVTWPQWIGLLIAGAVGAGLCEEILFRGVVQGLLARRGRWFAIIATAIIFGLFHLNRWQFLAGIVLGVCFGWMVERSGSLWVAITAHACANATAFTLAFIFGGQHEAEPWPLLLGLACLSFIGLGLFHGATRRIVTPPPPLSQTPVALPRWVKWTALAPVAMLALLISARVVGAVQVHRMAAEIPELSAEHGDLAISMSRKWFPVSLQPGDAVTFRDQGRTKIRRVERIEQEHVIVSDQRRELPVNQESIIGKVVYWLRLSAHDEGKKGNPPVTEK